MIFYKDSHVTIHQGHVLDELRTLADESVHMVMTSAPYWALRDYKLPAIIWGGDPLCEHQWNEEIGRLSIPPRPDHSGGRLLETHTQVGAAAYALGDLSFGAFCSRCNAWQGSLGLEPTPTLYVAHLVEIFREVHRVLRHDGTVWLNMGDCYVKGKPRDVDRPRDDLRRSTLPDLKWSSGQSFRRDRRAREDNSHQAVPGLKPKDLVGIPWMVAFALRNDGWYLRQDNIWGKRNPMPESARDRTTRAHEYVFHLSKNEEYFYDDVATFEPRSKKTHTRGVNSSRKAHDREGLIKAHRDWQAAHAAVVPVRNMRSVWSIATQAFKGAHFATFPEKLVEPCIKAGTSEFGVCSFCGAPWERIVRRVRAGNWNPAPGSNRGGKVNAQRRDRKLVAPKWEDAPAAPRPDAAAANLLRNTAAARAAGGEHDNAFGYVITEGWRRTCKCELFGDVVPAIVLDPFGGSFRTCAVAKKLGRRAIAIELSTKYCEDFGRMTEDAIPPGGSS